MRAGIDRGKLGGSVGLRKAPWEYTLIGREKKLKYKKSSNKEKNQRKNPRIYVTHMYRVSKKSRDGWIFPQVKYFSKK